MSREHTEMAARELRALADDISSGRIKLIEYKVKRHMRKLVHATHVSWEPKADGKTITVILGNYDNA